MILLDTGGFFQEFNFDTLLALISCIAGVIALFLGGAAYNHCKIIKKSFNDEKNFEDESEDHSQRAGGDIINNNGITDSQLATFTTALTTLSNDNFSKAVDQAYATFRLQTDENMKHIIAEAERIVSESKWQIAGYTKIDWINIYFESAKNASDPYMQAVWAKVLAAELASPGTFSYKTLDVLKNMSADDFRLYEKMISLSYDGSIFPSKALKDYLSWTEQLKLRELGLLSLEGSERTLTVPSHSSPTSIIKQSRLLLQIKNDTDKETEVKYPVRVITAAARELSDVASVCAYRDFFVESFKEIKSTYKGPCSIELHDVYFRGDAPFLVSPENILS